MITLKEYVAKCDKLLEIATDSKIMTLIVYYDNEKEGLMICSNREDEVILKMATDIVEDFGHRQTGVEP